MADVSKIKKLSSKTIIFVRNESSVHIKISSLLQKYFQKSHDASSAENAKPHVLQADALIVDIQVFGERFEESIRTLIEAKPSIPVVLLGEKNDTESIVSLINSAMVVACLLKPFNQSDFQVAMEKLALFMTAYKKLNPDEECGEAPEYKLSYVQEKEKVSLDQLGESVDDWEPALDILMETAIIRHLFPFREFAESYSGYVSTTNRLDFSKMGDFLFVAFEDLEMIDAGIADRNLVAKKIELTCADEKCKAYAEFTSQGEERLYETLFLEEQEVYHQLKKMIQKGDSSEKTLAEQRILLMKNLFREHFLDALAEEISFLDHALANIRNGLTYDLDMALWKRARTSNKIKERIKKTGINGAINGRLYLQYFLKQPNDKYSEEFKSKFIGMRPYFDLLYRRKILLLSESSEDSLEIKQMVEKMDSNCSIQGAANPKSVLKPEVLRSFNAIVIEYEHSVINGLEFITQLNRLDPVRAKRVNYIFIVRNNNKQLALSAVKEGVRNFIKNPATNYEIAEKIIDYVM